MFFDRNGTTLWLLLALAALVAAPAAAQLEIVDLTSPNIIGDSNLNGQPEDGPRVFTIAAKACNRSATNDLRDLFVHVGDGVTPGTFPVAVVPVGAPYLDEGYQLALLPGANPTRFEGKRNLGPGECIAFYFPVSYSVVDSTGDAVWGKSNTTADDLPYTFTIWASATDTVTAGTESDTLPKTVTVRNEITANPNKVQPNPQGQARFSLDFPPADPGMVNLAALPLLTGAPPAVAPGETITVYFENPTFGNPNQGFDLDGSPGPDYDLWFQPIGERYWNPSSFRLVKTQAFLFGTNCRAGGPTGSRELLIDDLTGTRLSINGAPFAQDGARPDGVWYVKDLDSFNCSAWDANWYSYTFLAIDEGQSRISPYQEVASGSDNEKYNGDYCGDLFGTEVADADYDTPHTVCVPLRSSGSPRIDLDKTVDKLLAPPGDTLTYTVDFTNVGENGIGSTDSGVQIVDAIPANTTYVGSSATCSLGATCVIAWSTDGGATYTQVEPAAASVTHIRWSVNQTLAPAAMGTTGFQAVIDNPFTGTVTNTARLRIDNGPFLLEDDAETGVSLGSVHLHLFVDDNLNGMVDATDSNGVQDAGEADLPDVEVIVTDSGGGMQTLTSDPSGDVWAIVPPGATTFDVVEATLPPGYVLTTGNDPQMVTAVIATPVDAADMGYAPPLPNASIGDRVWRDENGDGVQDVGEPGLNGVTVELRDGVCTPGATCPTQVTAGDGDYDFTALGPGTYTVAILGGVPSGFFLTTANDPTVVNLSPAEDVDTVDFGYEPINGVIGDFVWGDQNGDGVQDPAEAGLGGITLELQDGVCTPGSTCPTTMTDAVGAYLFTDVPPGTYTVDVVNPPPLGTLTTPPEPRTGIVLAQAEARLDVDFGYQVPTANIGDRVWNDLDNDGVQDPGEPGIDGVTVELLEVEDTMVPGGCTPGFDCPPCTPGSDCPTTVTAGGGLYLFDNGGAGYAPRQFRVQVDESSAPVAALDITTPSVVVVPLAGVDFLAADFGFAAPAGTVTKHVFQDTNGNGVQDVGEPDLAGVDVTVTESGGGMQTLATDMGGDVSFTVPVGMTTCDVVDATLPPGLVLTTANDPHVVNVTAGGTFGDDVGYQPRGTLTKHVYEDTNGNGTQDPGEPDLVGVTVDVVDSLGAMQSAATNATGDVAFSVAAGVATCDVDDATLPAGYTLTTGNDPHSPTVPAGGTVGSNVGYQPRGTLTKHVYEDTNGNGTQDPGEPDLVGVTVDVTDSQGVAQSAATNATGDVSFDVAAGVATCDVDDTTLPAGYTLTTGNDPHSPTVPPGGTVGDDVGYQPPVPGGQIGDLVWEDSNGNGVFDAGEPGLAGVMVELQDGVCTPGLDCPTQTTGAAGGYLFTGLTAGDYTVDVVDATVPAGHVLSTANDPLMVTLATDEVFLTADFGYQPRGTLTKHVYEDTNGNGTQDPGEPDLVGVTVDVTDSQGVAQSAMTNATGDVSFDVAAGVATCDVDDTTLPAGYTLTTGNDPHSPTVPPGGTVGSSVGYQPPVPGGQIGDLAWEDSNGNGVQDAGEPGLAGITVELQDGVCTPGADCPTRTTGAAGGYIFTGLPAGNYTVDVVDATVPAGHVLTTANDPLAVTLAVDEIFLTADFGYQPPAPPASPAIGVAKQVSAVIEGPAADQFDVTFALVVENLGDVGLSNVQVADNLTSTFPAPVTFSVPAAPMTTGTLVANPAFDGDGDTGLLDAMSSSLAVGASGGITFTVRITVPSLPAGPFFNTANAMGQDPMGTPVMDISDDGTDPDPNGDGDGDEAGENDPTEIVITGAPADPVEVPTMSEWGLILLGLLLALGGVARLRHLQP